MTDRNDRPTDRGRPIPPPPGRAVPDDDVVAVAREFEADSAPAPTAKERRSEFQQARRLLVDQLVAAGDGTVDHTAFNGIELADLHQAAVAAGIRPVQDVVGENRRLREAIGAELTGRFRHLDADDLRDLLDPASPFDIDAVNARAAEISQQRSESAQSLLIAGLEELGLNTSAEGFDLAAVLQAAAQPKAEPAELPDGVFLSTPAFRAANLPSGRPASIPNRWNDDGDLTGSALLEAAARDFLAEGKY